MSDTHDYLDTLLSIDSGTSYKEFKEFVRLMKEPSTLLTHRIRISKYENIGYLRDHVDVDILKAMKFRRVKIVDALWTVGNRPFRLEENVPEYIFREDAFSTFHLDKLGDHTDLGLRFSIKLDTLSCGFARDVHFNQPEWIELEFTGVHFHASK